MNEIQTAVRQPGASPAIFCTVSEGEEELREGLAFYNGDGTARDLHAGGSLTSGRHARTVDVKKSSSSSSVLHS